MTIQGRNVRIALTVTGITLFAIWAFWFPKSFLRQTATWQRQVNPGALSSAHSYLSNNCAACHTPVKGVEAANCIACHANNKTLLQREPTAFHADIQECSACHIEHQGAKQIPTTMDHAAFSRIGIQSLKTHPASKSDPVSADQFEDWFKNHAAGNWAASNPSLSAQEAMLNCTACHSKKDRHYKMFGDDCSQCHGTAMWTIPEFRHPSPASTSCSQCHQAPPSHYMEHFHMVSMRVARQPHAQIGQCYLCHETTVWNDIRGIGFYKHH